MRNMYLFVCVFMFASLISSPLGVVVATNGIHGESADFVIGDNRGFDFTRFLCNGKLSDFTNVPYWGFWWKDFPGRYKSFFDVHKVAEFGQTAWGLTSADFNNDGLVDFAVSWATCPFTYSGISIFYNVGNGKFSEDVVYIFNYSYITDLDSGDYDNDGDIDLMFAYSEYMWYHGLPINVNGTGKILFNDGNNHFGGETTVFWHGPGIPNTDNNRINPQLTSADFDNDGDVDFIVGDNSGLVAFYKNDGAGNFTNAGEYNFGDLTMSWGLASADFDNDGDVDFIVTETKSVDDGYIYLVHNDGTKSCFNDSNWTIIANLPFVNESFFSGYAPFGFGCLCTIDYNDDGKMDFLYGGAGNVILFVQKEGGTFEPFVVCRFPAINTGGGNFQFDQLAEGAIAVGDFNGDGLGDAVTGGAHGVVRVFYNTLTLVDIVYPNRASFIQGNEIKVWLLPIYPFLKRGTSIVIGDLTVVAKELEPLQRVEFYLDNKLVFTDDVSPFEWNWNRFSFGRHNVKAVAYGMDGEQAGFDDTIVWKFL